MKLPVARLSIFAVIFAFSPKIRIMEPTGLLAGLGKMAKEYGFLVRLKTNP